MSMTATLRLVSVKLPVSDLRRIPEENRSEFIRSAVAEKLNRMESPPLAPKSAAGRRMLALRCKFVKRGGRLLDAEGIAAEIRQRRGGLA